MAQTQSKDTFGTRSQLQIGSNRLTYYSLSALAAQGMLDLERMPFSIRILLEALLRNEDGFQVRQEDIRRLAAYDAKAPAQVEIPFKPARVILQDFTGVPSVVDLAALRSAMHRMGGDPSLINPQVRVDLVIDHSVQVDEYDSPFALSNNAAIEFERNRERYEFLRWGQQAFENFSVVPPASGIVHQVNLEYLAKGVMTDTQDGVDGDIIYPDTLVGTDSHTTMINGLGVLGWGVGGIEAEAVMLNQPIYMLTPEVVGVRISGRLPEGSTATDLALTVTELLRRKGVVDKFIEFFGPGLSAMTVPDRATIANMAPEYGATMGFFPVDAETLRFLAQTGRLPDEIDAVEAYYRAQGLFRTDDTPDPEFQDVVELDLSSVVPSVAGPKRPQDRIVLNDVGENFREGLRKPIDQRGYALTDEQITSTGTLRTPDGERRLRHGDIVIAAITSCTNTSNPSVMLAAGLVARKALEYGLTVPDYVKTSLAPGSKVVTEYLNEAGLTPYLDRLGFFTVGYGCTTCIGNSGPLPANVVEAIDEGDLVAASVLSGNRNFEGRINPHVRANYLASPPLVVAYALAGTVEIDLMNDPIGKGKDGQDVYLRDIWPTFDEVTAQMEAAVKPEAFERMYDGIEKSNEQWNAIPVRGGELFEWDDSSTYIQEPPFFQDMSAEAEPIRSIESARVLVMVGDSVTTDHISPAGAIAMDSPAGRYLQDKGVERKDFNSYGSRRGNDRIMTRGTFANIRLKNQLADGREGGWTRDFTTGEIASIHDASLNYKAADVPTIVLAGNDYGMGSSRDWAAKGTYLLGVKAVIAESFERIHRSNLIGMGVLPLQFRKGESPETLGLSGREEFTIHVDNDVKPRQDIRVDWRDAETGGSGSFTVTCRLDTPVEIHYQRNGGILHTVLRTLLDQIPAA